MTRSNGEVQLYSDSKFNIDQRDLTTTGLSTINMGYFKTINMRSSVSRLVNRPEGSHNNRRPVNFSQMSDLATAETLKDLFSQDSRRKLFPPLHTRQTLHKSTKLRPLAFVGSQISLRNRAEHFSTDLLHFKGECRCCYLRYFSSRSQIWWGYLPDEILSRIFTFPPIKSIIICTSVSKTWKSLIQNPTFFSAHFHHSHTKNNLLLLRLSRNDREVYTLHKEDDPDFTEYASLDSPFHAPAPHLHNVIGTCNGLLCLSDGLPNDADEFFLWNPCVRKLLQFPGPDVTFNTQGLFHASFGFGFDPKTNDYKVVRIRFQIKKNEEVARDRIFTILGSPKPPPVVEVYSLYTGEWRMLSASASPSLPPICAVSWGSPAFANGALHWIAVTDNDKQFVLVFDLGDKVFRQILLPELPSYSGKMKWTCVSIYGNSIAGFQTMEGSDQINIWAMEDYGVASSWTEFSHQCPSLGMRRPWPVGFRGNGEVILVNIEKGLVSWNPDSQNIKNLGINGYFVTFLVLMPRV